MTAAPTVRRDRYSMLSRCVATDTESFATRYWGRRPLLSRADALPHGFGDLLSPTAVDEMLAERGLRVPFIRMAKHGELLARECFVGSGGFGAEMPDQVDSAKVLAEFASGATIVLQGLHRTWPPLIHFVRGMIDDLGHPTQANAYVTPADSRGFDPHYDVHDVFVLQVAGDKRWIVHEPVHCDPLPSQPWTEHRGAITERVGENPFIDAVLKPGDALYVPRGWIHAAHTLNTTSIHLTIGVAPLTGRDVMDAVIDAMATDRELRTSLPMSIDPSDQDQMASIATKIAAEAADILRSRSAELSDIAAQGLSRRHAERIRPIPVRPLASLAASELAGQSAVQWRCGLLATVDHHPDFVVLRLPDRTIRFPEACGPAVAALHRGLVSDADGLPGLDRADAAVLIRRLLREAVLVPAEDPDRSASPEHG